MDPLTDKLRPLSGGRIIDIATSHGGFLQLLVDSFKDYTEAVGIDTAADRIEIARERCDGAMQFEVMNAENVEYEDKSFDTVGIRHSLHHLTEIPPVLAEMMRVLKQGGLFLICEVFQSPETLRDNSQRHLHHWWAEVDRALGVPHFETFTKEQILDIIRPLGLKEVDVFEYHEEYEEAQNREIVKQMIAISNDCIEKLKENKGPSGLIDKGNELIERFGRLGFTDESALYIMGRKL